jgi:tRNA(Ile)-lysidine synthase
LTAPGTPRVGVAVSGGRDSIALLHATASAAASCGVEVWALHVHHGLMPEADDWWRAVEQQCARWCRRGRPVQFAGCRLTGTPAAGQSLEAWARAGRYQALTRLAQERQISLVLLAQHRRDQAETVLLQALRSGGPPGLSAMPRSVQREGIHWVRPWLDHPRSAIEAYVSRYRLRYVNDPSNEDVRLARNRLRAQVWDAVEKAFPHAEVALASTARRMQEAAACNAELAAIDMLSCVDEEGRLLIAQWAELSLARRANVIRHWGARWGREGVPETLVARLLKEASRTRNGSQWPAPGGQVVRDKGKLVFAERAPPEVLRCSI